ncbi:Gfo/Idh/MocA family oxidoreductase [Bradyrhizobium sp. AUGA SZCCT0158]|uniref:Gfo/Idh/MocA family protein n=1 Tax=Bradyrhizobium sp. AUGA SZCCT0158 TaxID=2807661 RepID=UPI001BA6CA3C|nr:Gfo/Idh/MocA family oxidoreductase [Bradyrhizobium sp. AUGA SZCCT0158]MBR1199483.1 Gfo/Idh/MocA family oxidoreductase [Bradyrhizobium sp. AUGA SZCCT0158]
MSSETPLQSAKVTLIGAGRMGRAHALAAQKLGLSLDAVCDVRAESVRDIGDQFGVADNRRFTNAEDLFASGLDGTVMIATTADTHHLLTCGAAKAGAKAILCEKPMASSLAQCDEMIATCAKAGARLAINHQMRFMPAYQIVKEVLDSGKLGRLGSMNVIAGNFGLAMNGSHYIEAFHYLTGTWPVSASAWFSGGKLPNPRGPNFFDQAGEVRFLGESGQRLTFSIGPDHGHGMTVTYAGEYGHMFVDELEGEAIITSRLPEHRAMPSTRYGMPWERETRRFPQADNVEPTRGVIAALIEGRNYPDGQSGRRIVAALAACHASADNGNRPVTLAENEAAAASMFSWA